MVVPVVVAAAVHVSRLYEEGGEILFTIMHAVYNTYCRVTELLL